MEQGGPDPGHRVYWFGKGGRAMASETGVR